MPIYRAGPHSIAFPHFVGWHHAVLMEDFCSSVLTGRPINMGLPFPDLQSYSIWSNTQSPILCVVLDYTTL